MAERTCSEPECDLPFHAKGLCKKHHARANYAANRDARRAQQAQYRSERRGEAKARAQQWRADNPERVVEANRRYAAENPDKIREQKRRYRDANREKVRASNRLRKSREKAAPGALTEAEWLQILKAFEWRCAYCGEPHDYLTKDHRIPIDAGGEHSATNVIPACQPCNSRKGNRPAPPFHARFQHLE